MDEIRLKALEIATLCTSSKTGMPKLDPDELLEAARKIETYLRHRDRDDTPKSSPHPAAVHGLAN